MIVFYTFKVQNVNSFTKRIFFRRGILISYPINLIITLLMQFIFY